MKMETAKPLIQKGKNPARVKSPSLWKEQIGDGQFILPYIHVFDQFCRAAFFAIYSR
jgi:hypothetical protein